MHDIVDIELFKNLGVPDVGQPPMCTSLVDASSSSPNGTQSSPSTRHLRRFKDVFPYASQPSAPTTSAASSSQDQGPVAGPSGLKHQVSSSPGRAQKTRRTGGDNWANPIVLSSDEEDNIIDLTSDEV